MKGGDPHERVTYRITAGEIRGTEFVRLFSKPVSAVKRKGYLFTSYQGDDHGKRLLVA